MTIATVHVQDEVAHTESVTAHTAVIEKRIDVTTSHLAAV